MNTAAVTASDVLIIHDAACAIDIDAILAMPLDDAMATWAVLEDANRVIQQVRSLLVHQLAQKMGEHQVTVDGVGTFVRHKKKNRTAWDKDDLLRAVLDSRLVDTDTGEVADESPLDKVLAVWNLPAPRTTVLKARGIDADEFCRTEDAGWSIETVTS